MYALEMVATLAELEALRPQWQTLWRGDVQATPFQAPAWLLPWARHFAPDRVRALAWRERGRLVALLPFFTWQEKLLLAGTGPSDYGDGVFARRSAADTTPLLASLCTVADRLGCANVDLQQVRACSPLLRAATPSGWQSNLVDGDVCPCAPLPEDDGLQCVPARQRKDLAYAMRSLRKITVCALRCVAADELDAAVARIAALHAQRWGARETSGVFADPRMRAFLAAALPELAAAGILRLHVLQAGDEIIAAALVLQAHAAACLYLCTFDTRWSRYSPGLQTIAGAMREAANAGAREFHFLRGAEPYKYRLGAADTCPQRRMLLRDSHIR